MAKNALPPTEDPAKQGIRKQPADGKGGAVGEEKPSSAAMSKALGSSSFGGEGTTSLVGQSGLGAAVEDLYKQHPHDYSDLGPHHGTSDHQRHMPLHGLKPTAK